jgi:hypothetical protein
MLGYFGNYRVVVAGAGITGVVASIAAARQGAQTLLVEESGVIGGLVTGGRLTKPTGLVEGGIYREMLDRAEALGGADTAPRSSYWGAYSGVFDAEVMQRVIIELLEESGVEVLLHTRVTDAVADARMRGLEVWVKSGRRLILADAVVDASGDGDVAALAGAEFMLGRPSDGKTQPITSYLRLINVDVPRLAQFMRAHPDEFTDLVIPEVGENATSEDFTFNLFATGFTGLIARAQAAGDYRLPKDHITIKTGLLPGEMNINATRFQGNALDERTLTRAEIQIRKQAYNCYDFFKKYVPGFENAQILDVAPKLGVRETRRVIGDYILTERDVRSERQFPDTVGRTQAAIDIHEPGGVKGVMESVGRGYEVPYRCLLPRGIEGLLVAGRCISVDEIAHGSTRNTPVCALTGQAAGTAAALAASRGTTPRSLDLAVLQRSLEEQGIPLKLEGIAAPATAGPR